MKLILKSDDIFTIPQDQKESFDNDKPIFKRGEILVSLYYDLMIKDHYKKTEPNYCSTSQEVIDPNDKCNRTDVEELTKKQGILKSIMKGRPLPDLSLIVKDKWRMLPNGNNELTQCEVAAVNDGGHRSRTILEFVLGKFKTSSDTVYYSQSGQEVKIGNMYYKELAENHPYAIEKFNDYKLALVIQWNLDAKQRKEDFDNRNKVTLVKNQASRNAHDDNVIADFVRNSVREVDGELNPNPVHDLFKSDVFGFNNKNMLYDELVAKVMKMVDESDTNGGTTHLHQKDLDVFYLKGSYAGTDNGEFYTNKNMFQKRIKQTNQALDFLHGVLDKWPSKIHPKAESTVHALLRWYFQYRKDIQDKNMTIVWNDKLAIDYKIFAKKFALLMKRYNDDKTMGFWIKTAIKKRELNDAFIGYLGSFDTTVKLEKSVEWIMEEFYSSVKTVEDEKEFGLTHYDSRPTFKRNDIVSRWQDLGEKDDLGNSIDDVDEIVGDHDIPRSWGVVKGGITCSETNMKILHKDDNDKKSNKFTFEEFKKEKLSNDKEAA